MAAQLDGLPGEAADAFWGMLVEMHPTTPPSAPSWVPPDPAGSAPSTPAPYGSWHSTYPLGGAAPVEVQEPPRSSRRDILAAAVLLSCALSTALATLLSWRDYGSALDPDENGWRVADGSLGRGWAAVLIAIALAVGGVLLLTGRRRVARITARTGASLLVALPALEWAFGDRGSRTGPGTGLWIMFATGVLLLLLLGALIPVRPDLE